MRVGRTTLAAAAIGLLAAIGSVASSRKPVDYDAPTESWREGPVRYLLSKTEDDAYRALTDDAVRADFIRNFWASRDPVASTPDNEYRTQFYTRVMEANRLFTDSTKPGWKTDRGKIFILLGPPDDLEQGQGRDDFVPDVITWTYRSPPGGGTMDALPVIRFVRDATGEYRLSTDVLLHGFESTKGITFQAQAMQIKSLPEQKKVLDTISGAGPRAADGPFRTHGDFFRSADGATFTILTLGVKRDVIAPGGGSAEPTAIGPAAAPSSGAAPAAATVPPGEFEVLARLVGAGQDAPSYDFAGPTALHGGEAGPVTDTGGYLLFQGGLPMRPGTYTAFYGVVDPRSGRLYSFRENLEVPDLRDRRFGLSRISLASRVERVDRNPNAYTTPFVFGNLRVLPRPDDVFKNGEDFSFYYQIYGPSTDPIDGRPDFDVEYQFFVAQDDGSGGLKFIALGKSIRQTRQRSPFQGYAFPLKDWPRGTYRLRVQVKDNLSDHHATEEISFRVL